MKRILKLIVWVMLLGLPVVMTSCDGLVTAISDNPISPGLKVTTPSIQVEKGKTFKCNAKASSRTNLVYASADPSIATVDSYGIITGVAEGKTTITVTTEGKDSQAKSIFTIESVTIPVEVIKLDVPVKSVKLDKTTLTATLGDDPVKLVATVNPDNADFKTVEWTTSDETVVEVEDGVVTFVGAGTATITATATNGTTDAADDKTAKCEVTVNGISVTSVTLDKTELAMTVGDADVMLTATVKPDDATDKTVTWTSSNEAAATVVNGVVHAVAAGTATITAKAGDKTATCTVTVKVNATSLSLDKTMKVIKLGGDALTLTPTVTPSDATYTWESSDPTIATVENGVVTPVGKGIAKITAKSGELTATCEVFVGTEVALGSADYTTNDYDILSGNIGYHKISIRDGDHVAFNGLTVNNGIKCAGNATIYLIDDKTNTMTAGDGYAGIQIGGTGTTLTIDAETPGTGTLTVQGGFNAAGIGTEVTLGATVTGGNIVINGGTVNATGGADSAGIGTGYSRGYGGPVSNTCGDITINGGKITATGGIHSAGIGTGFSDGDGGYAINTCGDITISTGVISVTAKKSASSSGPYSIGKGYCYNGTQNCGTIKIGGVEKAQSDFTGSTYTYEP